MGYKVVRTIYKLRFEERPGMVVRTRGTTVEGFTEMVGLAGLAEIDTEGLEPGKAEEIASQVKDLLQRFARVLLDWNLEEEDGTPIPATLEGLRSLEFDFVLEIVMAWVKNVSDVSGPLVNSSTPGEMQEVAASLQMESLSPNPLSSLVPS